MAASGDRTAGLRVALLIGVAGVGWGLLAPAQKLLYAYRGGSVFDAATFVTARATWSAALLIALLIPFWRAERPPIGRGDWLRFATLWLCTGFGLFALFAIAAQLTSVAHIGFIVGLGPPAAALLEAAIARRPPDRMLSVAIGCGVCGVAVLASGRSAAGSSFAGDALMLLWVATYAINTLTTRGLLLRHFSPRFIAALGTGGGALALAATGIALGHGGAIFAVAAQPDVALEMLGVCVVWTGLVSPLAFAGAIRLSNVTVASAGAQYLQTAVGIVFSVVVLREAWTARTALAGALMLLSLGLTFAPRALPSPAHPPVRSSR